MPTITDLTGTKWFLNSTIESQHFSFDILYISDSTNMQGLTNYSGFSDNTLEYNAYAENPITVYSSIYGWYGQVYRTIEITGGTDVTNSTLIDWLRSNATQIVEDLSNTHWKLNNNLTFTNVGTKSINFKSGNTNFSSITISSTDGLKYNNTTIVEAPTAIIISFTIKSVGGVGTTYQAEEGMTWQEWVDSEYNIDGWFIQSNYVTNGVAIVRVATTDTIISGGLYSSAGGGFD